MTTPNTPPEARGPEDPKRTWVEEIEVAGHELVGRVERLLQENSTKRVVIRTQDGKELMSDNVDLERWFKTGELPQGVGFFVMVRAEDGRERHPDEYEQRPFPPLHPDALKMLRKMVTFCGTEYDFYNFDGYRFRSVAGLLPPHEQRRELMPHG